MSKDNVGGAAFPTPHDPLYLGMSLRDYFAAQALTGAQIWDAVLNGKEKTQFANNVDRLGEVAYAVADAMLKARNK